MKIDVLLTITFAILPVGGSCCRGIDPLILQEFFSSVPKFLSCNAEKH